MALEKSGALECGDAARHLLRSICAVLTLCLAACGGGGGGGGGGAAVDNKWLQFTPASAQVQAYQGDSTSFVITASSSITIAEPLQAGIIDRLGVLVPGGQVLALDAKTYQATLQTSRTLATGVHEGTLEVRLCRDNPVTCANPYPGSPWQVPYRFTVSPSTNLTALKPLAGATGWTAYQGGAAHTGYVPGTVNPASLGRRWVREMGPNGQILRPVVVDGGRVFATASNSSFALVPRVLTALSEDDGREIWRQSYDSNTLADMSPPTVTQGRVFVGTLALAGNWVWTLRGFDVTNGLELAQSIMAENGLSMPMGPTAFGDAVFAPAFTGIARHLASDATRSWLAAAGDVRGFITPAVDASAAYAYFDDRLVVVDLASGSLVRTLLDPEYVPNTAFMNSAPVLGGGGRAYVTGYGSRADSFQGGHLVAFDTNAGSVTWTVVDRFRSNPVLAGSTLYVVNDRSLQAREAATGALLWQWTPSGPAGPGTGPNTPLVVVGQHAFVGIDGQTFAVDLSTRQSVWTYPTLGPLAVSAQGVLYIVDNAGTTPRLHAINLH